MASTLKMPKKVEKLVREIEDDPTMNRGMTLMSTRIGPDLDKIKANLIGIANDPFAREHFESKMDEMWRANKVRDADEIIIGGGISAATYAAVRMQIGANKPLVIERDRLGGQFGKTKGAAFYLNSGNRPGNISQPGEPGALNAIPGSPIQPSDLTGDEYQKNSDLAFCIRASLAMTADVVLAEVVRIEENGPDEPRRYSVVLSDGTVANADRVISATGLGKATELPYQPKTDRVLNFDQFMQRMADTPFPLQGINSVAVVGTGDGGKVVMEALTGQGPSTGWSTVGLDYPEAIDWYGQNITFRDDWCARNRTRYAGLGRLFRRRNNDGSGAPRFQRMRPMPRASKIVESFDGVKVNGKPYDLVIVAIGFQPFTNVDRDALSFTYPDGWTFNAYSPQGSPETTSQIETLAQRFNGQEVYLIGPVANIGLAAEERITNPDTGALAVPENSAAIWRYAPRTATLAFGLGIGTPQRPATNKKPLPEIDEEPAPVEAKSVKKKGARRNVFDTIASPFGSATINSGIRKERQPDGSIATIEYRQTSLGIEERVIAVDQDRFGLDPFSS